MLKLMIAFVFVPNLCGFLLETDPVVDTDCGPVHGISSGKSFSFRGIPYASPPVGDKRWRPPRELTKQNNNCWTGTLNATEFGNICFQTHGNEKYMGSEDCLYLNVWTPSLNPQTKLPVAVWIHGGYLEYGAGNQPSISPSESLAQITETVYVSMNYRLHALGFISLKLLADDSPTNTSGNYGFMDMIAALQWVQRNIENFGGDKDQVTVFGVSSGGTAIIGLLASPLARGLFHKAWLASASPILNKTAADAFKDNMVFVNNTGCRNVSCLYALSAEDVVRSIPWDVFPYWRMADQNDLPEKGLFDGALPVIDGYVLQEAPFDAWVNGRGNDVPILIGTAAQETELNSPYKDNITTWNWTIYEENVREKLSTFSDFIAEMALKLYPVDTQTPGFQYTSMASDLRMNCGNDYLSLVLAKSFRSPVYRYVMTYMPSAPFKFFPNATFSIRYASHALDAVGFFGGIGQFLKNRTINDFLWEILLIREFSSFIKFGKPSTESWDQYPLHTALLSDTVNITSGYHAEECQFWLANGFFSYSWLN